jgi:hypothetical protein
MHRDIIVTGHLQEDASWLFVGQVLDYGTDGVLEKETDANATIGSTSGITDGQAFLNGASMVLAQLAQDLT